ncbi:hypothetical protein [Pyruvatibacter mobilis]|uniref:hypothetical protein n=1 Tax=Pyruvatibacter mobilis TaxID=1712261 RepID=UPI003BABB794
MSSAAATTPSSRRKYPALERLVVMLAASLLLAGCLATTAPPQGPVNATLTFGHTEVMALDVAEIDLAEAWQQPGQPPHIGHLVPNNPVRIIRTWTRDRLRAVPGGLGAADGSLLRVTLLDGSVTEKPLPVEKGVEGFFKDQADTRIEAVCEVAVDLIDPVTGRIGGISVKVEGKRDILESASLNERDRIRFALMEEIATSLNQELENGIRAELGYIIRR